MITLMPPFVTFCQICAKLPLAGSGFLNIFNESK